MCSLDSDISCKGPSWSCPRESWALTRPFFTTGGEGIRQMWELCHLCGMGTKLLSWAKPESNLHIMGEWWGGEKSFAQTLFKIADVAALSVWWIRYKSGDGEKVVLMISYLSVWCKPFWEKEKSCITSQCHMEHLKNITKEHLPHVQETKKGILKLSCKIIKISSHNTL